MTARSQSPRHDPYLFEDARRESERGSLVGVVAAATLRALFALRRSKGALRHLVRSLPSSTRDASSGTGSTTPHEAGESHPVGTGAAADGAPPRFEFTQDAPRPAPIDVLIIGTTFIPQCTKYRIDNKLEQCAALGLEARFAPWDDPDLNACYLPFCRVVVFYRVPFTGRTRALHALAKTLGIETIWEVDDLVFDPVIYAEHPYVKACPPEERASLLEGSARFRDFLAVVDRVIVSTHPLRDRVEASMGGKTPVHVVQNALSHGMIASADAILTRIAAKGASSGERITIGYGSGTRSHDHDLASVSSALRDLLRSRPNVELVLFGPLTLPDTLIPLASRVRRMPFLRLDEYLEAFAHLDVGIAPLVEDVFNECKSNIKFLEASVLGVPMVCTPCEPFRRAVRHGETGFLASGHDDWFAALTALVDDASLRRRVGLAARESVLAFYTTESLAPREAGDAFVSAGRPRTDPPDSAETKGSLAVVFANEGALLKALCPESVLLEVRFESGESKGRIIPSNGPNGRSLVCLAPAKRSGEADPKGLSWLTDLLEDLSRAGTSVWLAPDGAHALDVASRLRSAGVAYGVATERLPPGDPFTNFRHYVVVRDASETRMARNAR